MFVFRLEPWNFVLALWLRPCFKPKSNTNIFTMLLLPRQLSPCMIPSEYKYDRSREEAAEVRSLSHFSSTLRLFNTLSLQFQLSSCFDQNCKLIVCSWSPRDRRCRRLRRVKLGQNPKYVANLSQKFYRLIFDEVKEAKNKKKISQLWTVASKAFYHPESGIPLTLPLRRPTSSCCGTYDRQHLIWVFHTHITVTKLG